MLDNVGKNANKHKSVVRKSLRIQNNAHSGVSPTASALNRPNGYARLPAASITPLLPVAPLSAIFLARTIALAA